MDHVPSSVTLDLMPMHRIPPRRIWIAALALLLLVLIYLFFASLRVFHLFRAALPPDVSSRPPFIVTTTPYPVYNVVLGNSVDIMMASLKQGYATQLPDGTLQTLLIQGQGMPQGMTIAPTRINVPNGANSVSVQVYRLAWSPDISNLGDHPVTLTSSVTINGTTYTADPVNITFHVFTGAGGGNEELTNDELLQRLVDRNLTTATSVQQLYDSLSFDRVYQSMKTDVLLAALIRADLVPGYASTNPPSEAQRLRTDLLNRGVDLAHLRPDGLLTKLTSMTGAIAHPEPMVLSGSQLVRYRYWEAPLVAKNILQTAMGAGTGSFVQDFLPEDLLALFDDSINSVPGDPIQLAVAAWVPERLKTQTRPSFCPILPETVNGDTDSGFPSGRMLCVPKMRPESSIEGAADFMNSARSGDEAINDATLRSIAHRMARDLQKMPPGSRIIGMHGHIVNGTLLFTNQAGQSASVDVKFDDGLTDYIYPRDYPDPEKRFQPYQKSLIWMDEWRNIVRQRMDHFFPMLKEEIDATGGFLDGMYIDVENKALSLAELGGHTNPSYSGPTQDVYQMLRTDARWPEVSARLADAGICALDGDGLCPITAQLVGAWRTDERESKWNAVMEKRRAEYVDDAIAVPLHASFPHAEFFNYGNYSHDAFHPFANCDRFSDSCFGVGTLMGTHQSVNLYGYIRDSMTPNQTLGASSGARINTFEAANGVATIKLFAETNDPRFGTMSVADLHPGDRIIINNIRFGCLDAPYTAPQCPPPPSGSTTCTPGQGTCANCRMALLLSNGCTMSDQSMIPSGTDLYFGNGFGTGEYLIQSVDTVTNSITIPFSGTVPRITLYDNVSTTIWVRKQHFRTSQHADPVPEIKIFRMGTYTRMSSHGVNGSGVAIILDEPVSSLEVGQFVYISNRSETDFLPTTNGSQILSHPYEGKYEILALPNATTILTWTGGTLQPVDLSVINTASLYANFWRSWNAFAADIMQMRGMVASTSYGINPWIQHVDTTTEKNTSDRNDDIQLGDSDDPWKYYSESVFHIYLNGANRVLDWIWSKFSDDSVQPGNDLLNRTLNEVESMVGYGDRTTVSFEPVRWTDDYIITGMEAGGRRIYRVTPNELKRLPSTWNATNNPARITLGVGNDLIDVPLPSHSFVCTPSYHPVPCPQNPVSNYGFWVVQTVGTTLLRGTVADTLIGLQ